MQRGMYIEDQDYGWRLDEGRHGQEGGRWKMEARAGEEEEEEVMKEGGKGSKCVQEAG